MGDIWLLLSIYAVAAAAVNLIIHILVLTKVKMVYSYQTLFTEYVMSSVILIAFFKDNLDENDLLLILCAILLLWVVITLINAVLNKKYYRVYGLRGNMNSKVRGIAEAAVEKTGGFVRLYAESVTSTCNMVMLKKADFHERINVVSALNMLAKRYGSNYVFQCLIMILLDMAAAVVVIKLLLM